MNEYGQDIAPQKKSSWDILDIVLQPAVQVYTDLRGNKSPVPPVPPTENGNPNQNGFIDDNKCDEGFVFKNGKCVRETSKSGGGNTLLIVGGIIILSAAGFFLYKKFSNKPN